MDKQQLKQMVDERLSIREIVEKTGKCQASVRYWLKKYDLKTKIEKYNKGGEANRTIAWRSVCCGKCGETDPEKFYRRKGRLTNYPRCKVCHTEDSVKRYRDNKKKAVDYKGGKCSVCGYDKCMAALDFHHPGDKDVNWKKMRSWKFEKIKDELDKCNLVCKNCHSEIHSHV